MPCGRLGVGRATRAPVTDGVDFGCRLADGYSVIEAIAVLTLVGTLGVLALVAPLVSIEPVLFAGSACAALGLLVGVPTGFWYHVRLRASLLRVGRLPERWWVHPVALHGKIPAEERALVLLWFYVGGLGFVLTMLGCLVVALAVLLTFLGHF